MSAEIVETRLPRPPQVPDSVPDPVLIQAARDYLLGEDPQKVALMLDVSVQQFYAIVRTPQWRYLQNQFRDEFLATTGSRLIRLESKLIDKIEEYVDGGITCWATTKDGEAYSYQREITPKEAVSIALMLNDTNKRLDNLREGDATRKKFDAAKLVRDLEGHAKRIPDDPQAASA